MTASPNSNPSRMLRQHPQDAGSPQAYGSYPNAFVMTQAGCFKLDAKSQAYWDAQKENNNQPDIPDRYPN